MSHQERKESNKLRARSMWTFLSFLLNENKNNNNSSSNNRILDRFALSIIEWGQSATPWRTGWYYSLSSECLQSFTLSCGCTQYFYRLVYWYQVAPSGGRKLKPSAVPWMATWGWVNPVSRLLRSRVTSCRACYLIVVCHFVPDIKYIFMYSLTGW